MGSVAGVVAALSMGAPAARSQGSEDDDDDAGADDGAVAPIDAGLVAPKQGAARRAWLGEQIEAAITARPTLARARVAIAITDLTNDEELFARNGDDKLNLASNAKLMTATAALATLGTGFRWRTSVLGEPPDPAGVVAGDLILRGTGDPLLAVSHLQELADELVARGVVKIDGRLVLDTGVFDDVVDPPHFDEQPKERAGFRAPVASLGVGRSATTIVVVAQPGGGATVRLEPDAGDYHRIAKREVTSVTEGRTRLRVDTKPKRDHVEYEVSGQIRVGEGSWDFRRRVDDPARFCGEVWRRVLASRGISVRSRPIGRGVAPPTAKVLAFHDSAPLSEVVRFFIKMSDNTVAETVLKTMGAYTRATPGPATWDDGLGAVRAYLATAGLPTGSYRLGNGSGLFAATEVSARQVTRLLTTAHHDFRIGPDLIAALPIGGADGTLARRWQGQPARGRVRAKTGTLDSVITLAGYVGVDGAKPLAFAILVNDVPPGQRAATRALVDDVVSVLAAYLDAR